MRQRQKKKALKKHAEGRPLTWREREYVKTVPTCGLMAFLNDIPNIISRAAEKVREWVEKIAEMLVKAAELHQEWHYEKMRYAREGGKP